MRNELTSFNKALPAVPSVDRRIRRQAAQHMRRMAEIADITKAGMNEIGDISAYAQFEAVRTLVLMNLWDQASQLSPEQKQTLATLKIEVCQDLQRVTHISGGKIISLIESLPPEAQSSLWDQLADLLGG